MAMSGIREVAQFRETSRANRKPSVPGIMRSRRTTSTGTFSSVATASRAFDTVSTRWPSSVRRSLRNARVSRSSSTARIVMAHLEWLVDRRGGKELTDDADISRAELGRGLSRNDIFTSEKIGEQSPEEGVGEATGGIQVHATISVGKQAAVSRAVVQETGQERAC